eukprot:CAMPEP_0182428686 /NCGR_PEP_ID=MMETSP1167-20130531/23207_1 /TAXON_ID=2988 /ORGANISM="Mallomonas Sp, Strain CCMP3275" /LENGTH=201 /DNA_ID=CAMNT_0024611715 /DNA_START=308 /DNA_END=913 /DNA_ORIENTATION=-
MPINPDSMTAPSETVKLACDSEGSSHTKINISDKDFLTSTTIQDGSVSEAKASERKNVNSEDPDGTVSYEIANAKSELITRKIDGEEDSLQSKVVTGKSISSSEGNTDIKDVADMYKNNRESLDASDSVLLLYCLYSSLVMVAVFFIIYIILFYLSRMKAVCAAAIDEKATKELQTQKLISYNKMIERNMTVVTMEAVNGN